MKGVINLNDPKERWSREKTRQRRCLLGLHDGPGVSDLTRGVLDVLVAEHRGVGRDEATIRPASPAHPTVRRLARLDRVCADDTGDTAVALSDVHRPLGIDVPGRIRVSRAWSQSIRAREETTLTI